MASVVLSNVTKTYEGGFTAVRDLSLDVDDGEFLVMVGPSGCGKSSALRMIAGLEEITSGILEIGGRRVNDAQPKDRDIAMVFQSYALYPHMTVRKNIGFPLRLARRSRRERAAEVARSSAVLQLDQQLDKHPGQLSGGQRQRVAMGRALVRRPAVFLMDEPLSNLDAKLRVQMRVEISAMQRELGATTIFVTHDQVEAMTMADRVAILSDGELQQVGRPSEVYDWPVNTFVAAFIGSPPMNLIQGTLSRSSLGEATLQLGAQTLRFRPDESQRWSALFNEQARPVIVGIRPEDLEDAALTPGVPGDRRLSASVLLVEPLGPETLVYLAIDAPRVLEGDLEEGSHLHLKGRPNAVARVNPRSLLRGGEVAEFAVDLARIRLFDAVTGAALDEPE